MTDYTKLAKEWKKTDEYKRYPDLDTVDGFATFLNERASREACAVNKETRLSVRSVRELDPDLIRGSGWSDEDWLVKMPQEKPVDYSHHSHTHCYEQENPPCGLGNSSRGKHCCLCDIVKPTPTKALEELVASGQGVRTGTLLKKLNEVIRYLKNR